MKRAAERVIEVVREKWSERDKKQRLATSSVVQAPEEAADPFGADFVAFDEAEDGEVEASAAPPPWMARPHYASLEQELADFCAWVQPTRKERELREETIARLNLLVAQTFGGGDVSCHNFGSFHMGLALPGSDLDFALVGGSEVAHNPLRKLASSLRNKRMASSMNVIEHTRVPIVKYTDIRTGIDCDVSFDVTGGIMMGKVFLVLLQQPEFAHARSLIVLVKYWLKIRGLHEPFNGGLGSYSVLIMVVSLLQHHGKSGKSLAELFQLFFVFYGTQFNWITTGISLMRGGTYFSKKVVAGNFDSAEPWKPALEDCCDASNNISSSSYNFPQIREGFRATSELLASKKKAPFGLLPLVFPGAHLERIH